MQIDSSSVKPQIAPHDQINRCNHEFAQEIATYIVGCLVFEGLLKPDVDDPVTRGSHMLISIRVITAILERFELQKLDMTGLPFKF